MQLEDQASAGNASTPKQGNTSPWLYTAVAVLLIALTISVYLLMGISRGGVIVAKADSTCDLQQGPCEAKFPDGSKVTLSISPHPIQERQELHIHVWLHGISARSVYVNFLGQNMYMGYNRPQLERLSAREFFGTWSLASCGLYVEHMEWKTMVLIRSGNHRMAASFSLETNPLAGKNIE